MRLRPIFLSVLAVGLVAGGSALAAPKPVCKLVVDAEGDGSHKATMGLVKSNPLDITGADVATGKKDVVGVIRLKTTNVQGDPYSYLEYNWKLSFQIQGQDYTWDFYRSSTASGVRDSASASFADQAAEVTATVTADSITFKSPRKAFTTSLMKKPGRLYIDNIAATSWLMRGNADTAIGGPTTKYLDLAPHCLKPA